MTEEFTNQGITKGTIRGSAWLYGRMLLTNVINLGVMAILARQLTPSDFGLVALAQVLLRFLAVLGSSGVGEYVIYDNASEREERVHAAFWLGLSFALAVAIIGVASIPLLTRFYTEPGLSLLLILMVVRYPLEQLSIVPDALVKKTLNYKKLVIRDTILEILTSLGMVVMALTGCGVLSLVLPGLLAAPARALLIMLMAKWRPTLPFRFGLWKEIFRYSINIIGSNLATTITAEGDTLVLGKTLGAAQLGLYNLAWQSANLVARTVTGVVGKLAMPAFSAIAREPQRLRAAYKKTIRTLGFLGFPLLIGLFVVADLFVLTVYGPQWQQSILPLRILIIFALRHVVGGPVSVIPNAVGRPDLSMKYSLAFVPFYILSIWVGSIYGIIGVAIGVTLARTIFGLFQFQLGAKLIHLPFGDIFKELKAPLFASLLMGILVWCGSRWLNQLSLPSTAELGALVLLGGIGYLLILRVFYRKPLKELLSLLNSISPRAASMVMKLCWL